MHRTLSTLRQAANLEKRKKKKMQMQISLKGKCAGPLKSTWQAYKALTSPGELLKLEKHAGILWLITSLVKRRRFSLKAPSGAGADAFSGEG